MDNYLKLEGLSYSIPYGQEIIKSIDFNVGKGQFIGILGKNGSGKTTLIDLLLGNKTNYHGVIEVLGSTPLEFTPEIKQNISFISQDVGLKSNFQIRDFLDFHASLYPMYDFEYEKELMQKLLIDERKKIGALSTGQQKKIQIISGLASKPKLIIIDEITAVLDPEARSIFFEILEAHIKTYESTVLLATNIAEDLINRAEKVLFISKGEGTLYDSSEIENLFNIGEVA